MGHLGLTPQSVNVHDEQLCRDAGAAIVFAPNVEEI